MRTIFLASLISMASIVGFWGCQSPRNLASQPKPPTSSVSQVNYTLIYMIHGDANYLYHNEEGKSLEADVVQLKEAMTVAKKAKRGEVFIFHQQPEKKILGIFPKKDRVFMHYQNGKILHREKYSPGSEKESFITEQALLEKYSSDRSSLRFFLYYGHEIPLQGGINYHQSRSDAVFNASIFSQGAASFLKEGNRFELTVLSTCENGTPLMVSKLQSITNYLLASPQNLHLSHIDSKALLKLEENPDISTQVIANSIADDTYKRLSQFIQTAITLSVYDTDSLAGFLEKLTASYYSELLGRSGKENVDCATLPFWDAHHAQKGISVFYKPPNFGRHTDKQSYSGWGCLQ